jgi:prolipoprotein diacylglyceryltransferase
VFGLLIWAERRFRLAGGRVFAIYVAAYSAGRAGVEALRVDHANHVLSLRLNVLNSLLVFAGAVVFLLRPRREPPLAVVDTGGASTGTDTNSQAAAGR